MKKIAIVAPEIGDEGGVMAVVNFLLLGFLENNSPLDVSLISLASSHKDENSRKILDPRTWWDYPKIVKSDFQGYTLYKAGSDWVEWEPNRYKPRRELTALFDEFDLVQIVCGIPSWGFVAVDTRSKIFMQVATLAELERGHQMHFKPTVRGLFQKIILQKVIDQGLEAVKASNGIFVENEIMNKAIGAITPGKTIFAPPGIDTSVFARDTSKTENCYFLSIGRLGDQRKDYSTLIRAYGYFLDLKPKEKPELVIAGNGSLSYENIELIDELQLKDRITIKSNLSQEEVVELYSGADIFVLSSLEEGLGIVLIEAMASGLPIITTDCGGPRTLVEENINGLFTSVGDSKALGQAIYNLWSDPKKREIMSKTNRIKAMEFDTSVKIKSFLSAYNF